jgi:hypothetical protein
MNNQTKKQMEEYTVSKEKFFLNPVFLNYKAFTFLRRACWLFPRLLTPPDGR